VSKIRLETTKQSGQSIRKDFNRTDT